MALNVYLTVFKKYTTKRLRNLEVAYILTCYGIPFVPAMIFLFPKDHAGVPVYGSATLWCWVSNEWQFLRIACFYGPVWLGISPGSVGKRILANAGFYRQDHAHLNIDHLHSCWESHLQLARLPEKICCRRTFAARTVGANKRHIRQSFHGSPIVTTGGRYARSG